MPDTYGAPFDQTRGLLLDGWPGLTYRPAPASQSGDRGLLLDVGGVASALGQLQPGDLLLLLRLPQSPQMDDRLREAAAGAPPGVLVAGLAVSSPECSGDLLGPACSRDELCCSVRLAEPAVPGGPELCLKVMLNSVSTFAQAMRGMVYRGRMVGTAPTNSKIYARCVRLVQEFAGGIESGPAERALLQAVYRTDSLEQELLARPQHAHIEAATPTGPAMLQQDTTLVRAVLIGTGRFSAAEAAMAVAQEPRLAAHLQDQPQGYALRLFRGPDLSGVRRVCLATGDEGRDACSLYPNHPDMLSDRWAAPYCLLEPAVALVLQGPGGVAGYCLATPDSQAFYAQLREHWLGAVCERYEGDEHGMTQAEQTLLSQMKDQSVGWWPDGFPAHLHIDLLPEAQGKGHGSKMIQTMLYLLQSCEGVHLEVHANNERAQRFYLKHGFQQLKADQETIWMGKNLTSNFSFE